MGLYISLCFSKFVTLIIFLSLFILKSKENSLKSNIIYLLKNKKNIFELYPIYLLYIEKCEKSVNL